MPLNKETKPMYHFDFISESVIFDFLSPDAIWTYYTAFYQGIYC